MTRNWQRSLLPLRGQEQERQRFGAERYTACAKLERDDATGPGLAEPNRVGQTAGDASPREHT